MPTFDNTDELFHVVVRFAVVNHGGDREDQLGLDLRESVKNPLGSKKREREIQRERERERHRERHRERKREREKFKSMKMKSKKE